MNHKEGCACKVQKQGRDENTRRLHYYTKIVVKKDQKTILHLHLLPDYAMYLE